MFVPNVRVIPLGIDRSAYSFSRSTDNLSAALDEFQQNLSSDQRAHFDDRIPTPEEVVALTYEIEKKSSDRKSHILVCRIRVVLEAVQQYSAIVDTVVQVNPIAALVWSSVKIVVQVIPNTSLTRTIFFDVLRSGSFGLRNLLR